MSHAWLGVLAGRDDIEVVGLVDPDTAAAERKQGKYELDARVFADLGEALAAIEPDVVLDVAVPEARHQIVTTALAAGCHVLSEKPMAATLDEARDLVRAAEAADRSFAVLEQAELANRLGRGEAVLPIAVSGNLNLCVIERVTPLSRAAA